MVYWYRIVICKNDNCRNPIDHSYLGQTETSRDVVKSSVLGAIDLRCPVCGTLGTYTGTDPDGDIKMEPRDHPPDTQPS